MMRELSSDQIADLRAKIALQFLNARDCGQPVINLVIAGGPLDGMSLTRRDDDSARGFVGWNVNQPGGPVAVMHSREGVILKFTQLIEASR